MHRTQDISRQNTIFQDAFIFVENYLNEALAKATRKQLIIMYEHLF